MPGEEARRESLLHGDGHGQDVKGTSCILHRDRGERFGR